MSIQRRTSIKRTPLRKVERRDCKACGKRIERRARDAGWAHVRTPILAHQPIPYASKRTPKRTSLMRQADAMWAQIVKATGVCAATAAGYASPALLCGGPLEAAHIVPRRHRSTRWDVANGRAICHAHHRFFTDHEKAWRDFIGPEWDRLWVKAQELWNRDYAKVFAELRAYPRSVAEVTEP